jgi:hypothetical protein
MSKSCEPDPRAPRWRQSTLAALVACAVLGPLRSASAADPQLQVLTPAGVQRGGESTLVLQGPRLGKQPRQLLCERPGIEVLELKSLDDNRAEARLHVRLDCPLGNHPVRVLTSSGLSNLMTLSVGDLPQITEQEPNSDKTQPQPISLGTCVEGVITNEDVDYYEIAGEAGQRLSVEIEGLRLGRTFFDPAVALYDSQFKRLAANDDLELLYQDAAISLLLPATGKYLLEVRETSYQGSAACAYRLHVGTFPRPLALFPPGGTPGETLQLTWLGDPRGQSVRTVTLPSAPADEHPLFFADDQGTAPSPLPVRVNSLPNALEVEPNDQLAEATPCPVPGGCCGILSADGDRDCFRFEAKKGQVLDIRVHARRLRSPLDPVLRIRDAKGKRLAGNDDDQGHPDSYARLTIPADGEYTLEVEDHLGRGGPCHVYRAEITPREARVDLQIAEQRRFIAQVAEVPRGNRTAVLATATRRDWGGELELQCADLPQGVTATAIGLAKDYNLIPVLLEAAADAPQTATLAQVSALPRGDAAPFNSRFQQQSWLVRGANNIAVWSHFADRLPAAVTQEVPFSIEVIQPQAPLVQNGAMDLRVVAKRQEGFDGSIAIRMLYNPPGVSSNASRSIVKGSSEAVIPITANGNASTRPWDAIVLGQTNLDGLVVVASQIFQLHVVKPFVALSFPTLIAKQGAAVDYPIQLQRQTPFEGSAHVTLGGLPPGVTTEPVEVSGEADQIVFRLQVAADARIGRHKGQFCRLVIQQHGEPVSHSFYGGELRIDAPPAQEQASTERTTPSDAS